MFWQTRAFTMIRLGDISRAIDAPLPPGADAELPLTRVTGLEDAGPDAICYVSSDKYADRIAATRAAVVIASAKLKLPETPAVVLRVADTELAIGKCLELLAPPLARPPLGLHPSAVIDTAASVGSNAAIGPNVSIDRGARIGHHAILHAGVVIGADVVVGDNVELFPGVVLRSASSWAAG